MRTIDDLFKRVRSVRKRIAVSEHPAWYRGLTDERYELLPPLLREYNLHGLDHERDIFSRFMTRSAGILPGSFVGGWDLLYLMQHHGVPTRLLDWTESIDVALFFAVLNRGSSLKFSKPAIWVLNPFRLNEIAFEHRTVFGDVDDMPYDYIEQIRPRGQRAQMPHCLPIGARPKWFHQRIARQRGCFTIHGKNMESLEKINTSLEKPNRKFLKKIAIPHHLVRPIKDYLHVRLIDEFDMFGDPDSLGASITKAFSLQSKRLQLKETPDSDRRIRALLDAATASARRAAAGRLTDADCERIARAAQIPAEDDEA